MGCDFVLNFIKILENKKVREAQVFLYIANVIIENYGTWNYSCQINNYYDNIANKVSTKSDVRKPKFWSQLLH